MFKTMDDKRKMEIVKGAILGSVIGDALGVPGEFLSRSELRRNPITDMTGGGVHEQLPGTWSDDTSMVLCTMDSLIEKGMDYDDQMKRFEDWLWNASNTAHDEVFDVGGTVKQAIFRFAKHTPALQCGDLSEYACGNGSLMRIIPTALYLLGQYNAHDLDDQIAEIIHDTSKCTHAHIRCQMACGIFCSIVFRMVNGGALDDVVKSGIDSALMYYRQKPEFSSVIHEFKSLGQIDQWEEDQIRSSGYVLHTLQAAIWTLLTTSSYPECVLKAVNLGDDTDTVAAIAGALAGFWYGEAQIPGDWKEKTAKYKAIRKRAEEFYWACVKEQK